MPKTRESQLAYLPFNQAADAWLDTRRPYLAPRTFADYEKYIKTLSNFFGEMKLSEMDTEQLRAYQRMRMSRAAGRKINQELGVIQQLLKRIGRWQEVGYDYQRLPEPKQSPGRALSDQEYDRLFRVACSRPQWEMAYLFAAISVNTTAGPKEVWTLRLKDVNFQERTIRIQPGGAKTPHRIRVIPLNDIAFAAVERALELARKRGSVDPEHYLFPFRVRGNGTWGIYDPTKHCTTCNGAWRKLVAAAALKGLRPYDLRHTAITDILQDPDVSEQTAKAIAGHISDKILKTYSHIRISAKRNALDSLICKSARSGKEARRHSGRSVSSHSFRSDCGVAADVEEQNASEEGSDLD
ncbi:MAG TPA: tyrosine-type recombinase/integrase [Terriglobales bacterium]|nr:tyrosine-type recombinase/integrase [Terriglobales bacterium]